jgi:DNA polymerase elongation subunit (family B)
VPLEKLLAALRLSRELDDYRVPSPAARAATQLRQVGKEIRPGQRIRLLYLRGKPGVHAWNLPYPPDPRSLDLDYYRTLMLRAAEAILIPLGGKELLYPQTQKRLMKPLSMIEPAKCLQTLPEKSARDSCLHPIV